MSHVRQLLRLPGIHRFSAVYLLGAIFLIFSLWIPETFLSSVTLKSVTADQVTVAILALGALVPLAAGAFDLSIGSTMAFSLVLLSWLQQRTSIGIVESILIALAACALVGVVNGFLVVRLRVNSFIATLGMGQVLAAAALYTSSNQQIVGVFSSGFVRAGRRDVAGVPIVVLYLAVLALVAWYVLEWTPLGRRLFATGFNAEAAQLSGVHTDRVVWASFVVSGFVAGLAGVIFGAKVGSFSNSFGEPLLLPAFAAIFLGATQVKQRPNVIGTILAVYTLAFGVKGLQLAVGAGVYWITPLFNGVALLLAVGFAVRTTASAAVQDRAAEPSADPSEPGASSGGRATAASAPR